VNADVIQTSTSRGVLGAKNASTLQNRLINSGFTLNQRGYVSGTSLSSGSYGHDRWKGGASGGTYTFTQGSTGVPIVITITAGSIQQVIEGCNMPEGGTYVLSWTGTAQARFNGGSYGSSPLAVTGITAGANTTIEFNTGTLSYSQLEVGASATGFEYRQYTQEIILCQRYFQKSYDIETAVGTATDTGLVSWNYQNLSDYGTVTIILPVRMRSAPTAVNYNHTLTNTVGGRYWNGSAEVSFTGSMNGWSTSQSMIRFNKNATASTNIVIQWTADAEL
jgi:hypothetical protein